MDLVFEKGSDEQPKGHALLYFRSSSDPEELWVTYLVILPITVDVSKYVPPFLMNQVGEIGPKDLSAFAFPPAPERLGSYSVLEEMANQRDDDILSGGTLNPEDTPAGMMSIHEAVQQYAEIYAKVAGVSTEPDELEDEDAEGLGVNEVLYGLMSDSDKLSELTKLVSRLRFAIDGDDQSLIKETERDIGLLSRHLPRDHSVPQLVEAVKSSDSHSAAMADLYLKRCFHLVQEDYAKLAQIEEDLKALEGSGSPGEA